MAEPEDEEEEEGQKTGEKRPASAAQPSLMSLIISVLALTLVAAGGGSFLGLEFADRFSRAAGSRVKTEEATKGAKPPVEGAADIVMLAPIITNLGAPKGTWVRLEAALVVEGVTSFERDALVAKVAEDTVAFLRTVPLAQIEGATGFQNLREDLNDRVRVRSEGKARELLIQTLIVE